MARVRKNVARWSDSVEGRAAYIAKREETQKLANELGFDYGIECNGDFPWPFPGYQSGGEDRGGLDPGVASRAGRCAMTRASLVATADMSLVEDVDYHITASGLVHIDGSWYTLEQIDPELAERELADAIARYHALCKRPRSRHAWSAIAMRLWNAMQGPANLAMLPSGSARRRTVHDAYLGAQHRAEYATRMGRSV